jgi:mRNA interferase MazF
VESRSLADARNGAIRHPASPCRSDRSRQLPQPIVVPFTTRVRHKLLPSHVLVLTGASGLTQDSVALCEQIRVIDVGRLMVRLGQLSAQRMNDVADALKAILEL